mmetsp:Transcript_17622/g.36067  ORF Transcript_17622/g.36067 Transcript_17622/m.36067 type:complete len:86 (-) Transcript_17622:133-390(-)
MLERMLILHLRNLTMRSNGVSLFPTESMPIYDYVEDSGDLLDNEAMNHMSAPQKRQRSDVSIMRQCIATTQANNPIISFDLCLKE